MIWDQNTDNYKAKSTKINLPKVETFKLDYSESGFTTKALMIVLLVSFILGVIFGGWKIKNYAKEIHNKFNSIKIF